VIGRAVMVLAAAAIIAGGVLAAGHPRIPHYAPPCAPRHACASRSQP
jgi:hypothetical protein